MAVAVVLQEGDRAAVEDLHKKYNNHGLQRQESKMIHEKL